MRLGSLPSQAVPCRPASTIPLWPLRLHRVDDELTRDGAAGAAEGVRRAHDEAAHAVARWDLGGGTQNGAVLGARVSAVLGVRVGAVLGTSTDAVLGTRASAGFLGRASEGGGGGLPASMSSNAAMPSAKHTLLPRSVHN